MVDPIRYSAAGRPTRIVIQPMTKASVDNRAAVARSSLTITVVMMIALISCIGVAAHRYPEYRAAVAADARV